MPTNVKKAFKGDLVCSNCGSGFPNDPAHWLCYFCGIPHWPEPRPPVTAYSLAQEKEERDRKALADKLKREMEKKPEESVQEGYF